MRRCWVTGISLLIWLSCFAPAQADTTNYQAVSVRVSDGAPHKPDAFTNLWHNLTNNTGVLVTGKWDRAEGLSSTEVLRIYIEGTASSNAILWTGKTDLVEFLLTSDVFRVYLDGLGSSNAVMWTGKTDLAEFQLSNAALRTEIGETVEGRIPKLDGAGTNTHIYSPAGNVMIDPEGATLDYWQYIGKVTAGVYLNIFEAPTWVIEFYIGDGTNVLTIGEDGIFLFGTGTHINEFSTDGTMADDSDNKVPTQKAVKSHVASVSNDFWLALWDGTNLLWQQRITDTNDFWTALWETNAALRTEIGETGTAAVAAANAYTDTGLEGRVPKDGGYGTNNVFVQPYLISPSGANSMEILQAVGGTGMKVGIADTILYFRGLSGVTQAFAVDGTNYLVKLKTGGWVDEFSTDGTLGGNSDSAVPTEKAVKTYVDANAGSSVTGSVQVGSETNAANVIRTTFVASQATQTVMDVWLSDAVAGPPLATAPDGGATWIAGTNLYAYAANKHFRALSDSSGKIVLDWTESVAKSAYANLSVGPLWSYSGPLSWTNIGGSELWWEFTTTNAGVLIDSSPLGNNPGAEPNGTSNPLWENVTGANYALHFDGTDDYVSRSNLKLNGIDAQTVGTISAWVYEDADNGDYDTILTVSAANGSSANYLVWYCNLSAASDWWQVTLVGGGATKWSVKTAADSTDGTIGKWAHLVFVKTASSAAFYWNATNQPLTEISSTDWTAWMTAIAAPTNVIVGRHLYDGTYYHPLDGSVDEVQFYPYAMTATQVTNLFNEQKFKFGM